MSCSVDDIIIYEGLISKPDMRLTDIYDTIKTEDRANAFEAGGIRPTPRESAAVRVSWGWNTANSASTSV